VVSKMIPLVVGEVRVQKQYHMRVYCLWYEEEKYLLCAELVCVSCGGKIFVSCTGKIFVCGSIVCVTYGGKLFVTCTGNISEQVLATFSRRNNAVGQLSL
jgi:hypothetical protein